MEGRSGLAGEMEEVCGSRVGGVEEYVSAGVCRLMFMLLPTTDTPPPPRHSSLG